MDMYACLAWFGSQGLVLGVFLDHATLYLLKISPVPKASQLIIVASQLASEIH